MSASTTAEILRVTGERLRTQDNRITQDPMFCVQIKVRDVGYDSAWFDQKCWHDGANEHTIYDDDKDFVKPPEGDEWDEFGYKDRWETVMVAFTQKGCEEYLELNGHNDRRHAHKGEVRIYAESFRRCPEMIAIREALMKGALGVPEAHIPPYPPESIMGKPTSPTTCTWHENENGAYETGCGHIFECTTDGPKENGFHFCSFCGGSVQERPAPKVYHGGCMGDD